MEKKTEVKNKIFSILTSIPILLGIFLDLPLIVTIAILVVFIPISAYYIGLVIMARAKNKIEEEKRKDITFTGY